MRLAATLVHFLPALRARVRVDSTVLVEVCPSGRGEVMGPESPVIVMSPCGFHRAVAQAHQEVVRGGKLTFLHLPAGVDPVVDVGTPSCGLALPGGIYRMPVDGQRWRWAFATTLDAKIAFELGRSTVDDALVMTGVTTMGLRPDPETGVSVLFAETNAAPDTPEEAELIELLQSLMATWTAHELMTWLHSDNLGHEVS